MTTSKLYRGTALAGTIVHPNSVRMFSSYKNIEVYTWMFGGRRLQQRQRQDIIVRLPHLEVERVQNRKRGKSATVHDDRLGIKHRQILGTFRKLLWGVMAGLNNNKNNTGRCLSHTPLNDINNRATH